MSLNSLSEASGTSTIFVLAALSLSIGAVLTGLRERNKSNLGVFKAQLALAAGIVITGIGGYLQPEIYSDGLLLIGIALIAGSVPYIWYKHLIPELKNALNQP